MSSNEYSMVPKPEVMTPPPPGAPYPEKEDPTLPKAHWSGGWALVLAIVALILAIFALVLILVNSTRWSQSNNLNESWTVVSRSTSSESDTFNAINNSMYINNSTSGVLYLSVYNTAVSGTTAGSMFIINNYGGSDNITACFGTSGTTITCGSGSTGTTTIAPGTATQFMWNGTSATPIRLWSNTA